LALLPNCPRQSVILSGIAERASLPAGLRKVMTPTIFAYCFLLQSITPEVIEHSQAAEAAARQGKFSVAIEEYRKVTALQPNSALAHARLGDAYFQNGEYAEAIPELETALRFNPAAVQVHQTLGVLLLMQGDAEAALPHLEKGHSPELLGLAYLETGRLGSAIAELEAALVKQPNDPSLLYYFGRATDVASKRSAEQLAKLTPTLAGKSSAAADIGNGNAKWPPQDLLSLQSSLAKQPNDPGLLSAFSRATEQVSKQAFDRILQSSANSARAHQVLAERYVDSGHLPEAEREYAASLALTPNAPFVHLALGNVFASEGKWSAAVAEFRQETQLRPLSADAFYSLGSALLEQREPRSALVQLVEADRLRPDTPQILLALGRAAFAAQDVTRAEAAWTKLLGIDDQSGLAASAHLGLSMLYRQAGKSLEADHEKAAYEKLKKQGAAN